MPMFCRSDVAVSLRERFGPYVIKSPNGKTPPLISSQMITEYLRYLLDTGYLPTCTYVSIREFSRAFDVSSQAMAYAFRHYQSDDFEISLARHRKWRIAVKTHKQ